MTIKKRDRGRIVTWSPLVAIISRPTREQSSSNKSLTTSTVVVDKKKIKGTLDGHFRKDTHSLLLSMREQGHRTFQMLIDLPEKTIKRIYDGQNTWDVKAEGHGIHDIFLKCTLGNVAWEDGEVRTIFSRGFRLDWLQGMHKISISKARDRHYRKNHDSTKGTRSRQKHSRRRSGGMKKK